MFDNYKKYKNIKMPEDMKMNIIKNTQDFKSKKTIPLKRRVLIIAATFVCLTILASAGAAVLMPKYDYTTWKGSEVDNDGNERSVVLELQELYIAQVLELNEKTKIDSVQRVKHQFSNDLWIVLTDAADSNLTVITKEYGEFNIEPLQALSENDYQYLIKDFPEINEFIIMNGGNAVDVTLEQYNYSGDYDPSAYRLSDHNK